MTTNEAPRKLIYERIAAVMDDLEAIGKDRRNQQQGFNFRGIDDVYNALHPILAKHKVFMAPKVLSERTEDRQSSKGNSLIYRVLRMRYRFWTEDGSFVDAVVIGEGMDSGDKAANKAMAVAHKYAILQTFCVPTEDMPDPDAESPQVASNGPAQRAQQQMQQAPNPQRAPTLAERVARMGAEFQKLGVPMSEILKHLNLPSPQKIGPPELEKLHNWYKELSDRNRQ